MLLSPAPAAVSAAATPPPAAKILTPKKGSQYTQLIEALSLARTSLAEQSRLLGDTQQRVQQLVSAQQRLQELAAVEVKKRRASAARCQQLEALHLGGATGDPKIMRQVATLRKELGARVREQGRAQMEIGTMRTQLKMALDEGEGMCARARRPSYATRGAHGGPLPLFSLCGAQEPSFRPPHSLAPRPIRGTAPTPPQHPTRSLQRVAPRVLGAGGCDTRSRRPGSTGCAAPSATATARLERVVALRSLPPPLSPSLASLPGTPCPPPRAGKGRLRAARGGDSGK